MEDKISYKYADDLKALADEFAETPNPNGPSASGIYKEAQPLREGNPPDRFPCGKTLSEGFECDSPECIEKGCITVPITDNPSPITTKVLCPGCDADADCHKCDCASNAAKNVEASGNAFI